MTQQFDPDDAMRTDSPPLSACDADYGVSTAANPLRLFERELGEMRANVERQLVAGLREELHNIFHHVITTGFSRALSSPLVPLDELKIAANGSLSNISRTPCPPPVPPGAIDIIQLPGVPDKRPESKEMNSGKRPAGKLCLDVDPKKLDTTHADADHDKHSDDGSCLGGDLSPSASPHGRRLEPVSNFLATRRNAGKSRITPNAQWAKDLRTIRQRRGFLHKVVSSDLFDYFMGLILILNGILMGCRVDWESSNLGQADPEFFLWADRLFCMAFVAELLLRLWVFRHKFYFMKDWQWAYFDTAIVSIQVLEETWIIAVGPAGLKVGFLKLLKMGRLLRMVRMVRLIPELKSMVYLILASMSSFLWTCVLLLLLVYVLAVYMCMMATERLESPIDNADNYEAIKKCWGSLGSSILTLYWSITGGQDWADLIGPLVEETNQWHNVVFSMFIAFATMVIMNLVTGVFVEGAQRMNREDRDHELVKMAKRTFKIVDEETHTEITKVDFDKHLRNGHLDNYLDAVDLTRDTCTDLFELLDADHSNTVNIDEFVDGCMRLKGHPRAADVAAVLMVVRKQNEKFRKSFSRVTTMIEQYRMEMRNKQADGEQAWCVPAQWAVCGGGNYQEV